MNSLSWFLYFADVVGNVGGVFVFAALFCVGFCVVALIGQAVSEGDLSKECPKMWHHWWRCLIGAIVFGLMASLFPSRNTMYAIAASQFGEKIANNETVKDVATDAGRALQQWIKKQIEPEAKK